MTKQGFQHRTKVIALDRILPTRSLAKDVRNTQKFRTILASIREVGRYH